MSLSRSAAAAFFIALRRFSKVGSSAMGVRGYPGMDVPFLGYRRRVATTIRWAAAAAIHARSPQRGLAAIEPCAVRIALLHYSRVEATLVGEPERLWLVLGADRLAGPIRQHRPDLVVHGHAHHGSFEGDIDGVPVYNVAVHVMGREFWVFELDAERH